MKKYKIIALVVLLSMISGCGDYEPSPVTEASTIYRETTIVEATTVPSTESVNSVPENIFPDYEVIVSAPYNKVYDLNQGNIKIGNNMYAQIQISAPPELSNDDFVFVHDEGLTIDAFDSLIEERDGCSNFAFKINTQTVGVYNLSVFTNEEYAAYKEDPDSLSSVHKYTVEKLDSTRGHICYITQQGEKYHFSEYCPNSNSVQETIVANVERSYSPCKKCAW